MLCLLVLSLNNILICLLIWNIKVRQTCKKLKNQEGGQHTTVYPLEWFILFFIILLLEILNYFHMWNMNSVELHVSH